MKKMRVMIGSFQWQPVDICNVFTQTANRIMVLGCSWHLQDGVHIVVAKHFHLPCDGQSLRHPMVVGSNQEHATRFKT